ncbi:hypothetical protein GCM10022255_048650 [Dactylosporangium darangshiense]|uniref:Secreted protein n=1 Tax=Dactylosporangium darangshiense TaxID=579108 RepID=A0ABP8DC65_9ACTN
MAWASLARVPRVPCWCVAVVFEPLRVLRTSVLMAGFSLSIRYRMTGAATNPPGFGGARTGMPAMKQAMRRTRS